MPNQSSLHSTKEPIEASRRRRFWLRAFAHVDEFQGVINLHGDRFLSALSLESSNDRDVDFSKWVTYLGLDIMSEACTLK